MPSGRWANSTRRTFGEQIEVHPPAHLRDRLGEQRPCSCACVPGLRHAHLGYPLLDLPTTTRPGTQRRSAWPPDSPRPSSAQPDPARPVRHCQLLTLRSTIARRHPRHRLGCRPATVGLGTEPRDMQPGGGRTTRAVTRKVAIQSVYAAPRRWVTRTRGGFEDPLEVAMPTRIRPTCTWVDGGRRCTARASTSSPRCAAHELVFQQRRNDDRGDHRDRHRRARAHWKPLVHAGEVHCSRCGKPIVPDLTVKGEGWDVDERARRFHPAHATCNRSAGGRGEA